MPGASVHAGVIAVQGDVSEHVFAIERAADRRGLAVDVTSIRTAGHVPDCDVLAMPGGESTTISRLVHEEGIAPEIVDHVVAGKPLLATCAGLIVAASRTDTDAVQPLDLMDITVERNAFGRQKESFETTLAFEGLQEPIPAVFIRAPVITEVGAGVQVLAETDGRIVAARDSSVTGTAFHPELTDNTLVHEVALFEPLEI